MASAASHCPPVDGEYDRQVVPSRPLQLRIDPLADLEDIDRILAVRVKGSRPSIRTLLTERRDAMAALAAELWPPEHLSVGRPW